MAGDTTCFFLAMMEETARNREICNFLDRELRFAVRRTGLDVRQAEAVTAERKPDLILVMANTLPPSLKDWIFRMAEKSDLPFLLLCEEPMPSQEFPTDSGLVQYIKVNGSAQLAAQELKMKMHLAVSRAGVQRKLKAVRETAGTFSRPAGAPPIGQSKLIALGASMGGVEALSRILEVLPPEMPGIVVTQHMPAGFTDMYAKRLDRDCRLRVVQAADHQKVEAGTVYIAPGDFQMELSKLPEDGYFIRITDGERVTGHKPSVNVLFRSVARCAGKNALGILLTGMGDDGAEGLLEMRRAGADTVGQDAETSLVYGMPRVAFELGAVRRQLPLSEIPRCMVEYAYR